MIGQTLDQDVHLDVALVVIVTEIKVVTGIIEIGKGKELENGNVIVVIVNENENVGKEKEIEQFVKENVNVIDAGNNEKEKINHLPEEGNLYCHFIILIVFNYN